jgi:hypothetical protein
MKMHRILLLAGVLLIIIAGCAKQGIKDAAPLTKSAIHTSASADDLVNIADFSDNPVANWKLASPVQIYDKKTIFDYIDGAAEIYFAYDFNKVASAEYKNEQTSIIIDVYEMLSPDSAFGIYSLNRYQDANYVNIGNEGLLTGTSLDFWKGKYYCKTYCFDQSLVYQKDVSEFANRIALKIKEPGEEPAIIKKLMPKDLIAKSAKYFTRKLGLDNIHFVADENVLELSGETKGIVADYNLSGNRYPLFIIEYPSTEKAQTAFQSYIKYLSEKSKPVALDASSDNKAKMFELDGKFSFVKIDGQMLSGFWDIESLEVAKSIL